MRNFAKRKTVRLHGGIHDTRAKCAQQCKWDARQPVTLAEKEFGSVSNAARTRAERQTELSTIFFMRAG